MPVWLGRFVMFPVHPGMRDQAWSTQAKVAVELRGNNQLCVSFIATLQLRWVQLEIFSIVFDGYPDYMDWVYRIHREWTI